MRRPLLVLVLFVAWSGVASAGVDPPTSRPPKHVETLTQKVVAFARHQLGVQYSYGGSSRATGFDCSGLVYAAYRSIGWKIPRSSWDQLRAGRPVGFGGLQPGDLVFTEGGGHVQLVVSKRA